ncbi:MAG: hypothetical protein AAB875_01320 [Patescibacteria group bacterium]
MGKKVLEFDLVNDEKLERALHGTLGRESKLYGGVGDEAEPEALLAEYDRLGGLIMKGGLRVKMGSFYDFEKKQPRPESELAFMADVDGEQCEVTEEEAKTLKSVQEKKEALKAKKKAKKEEGEENPKKVKRAKKEDE